MAEAINFIVTNAQNVLVGSIAYFIVLWLALIVWTANDITRRPASNKMKLFGLAMVMIGNVFGFIVYLIIRPQTTNEEQKQEDLERKLIEAQLKNLYCRACEFPVKEEFILCPNCLKKLKNVCKNCSQLLEVNWLACPFCGKNEILDDSVALPAIFGKKAAQLVSKTKSRRSRKKLDAIPVVASDVPKSKEALAILPQDTKPQDGVTYEIHRYNLHSDTSDPAEAELVKTKEYEEASEPTS